MKAYKAIGFKTTEFSIKMTPKQLREIADEMEKQWKNALVGESTIVAEIYVDNYITIRIGYDQDKMESSEVEDDRN